MTSTAAKLAAAQKGKTKAAPKQPAATPLTAKQEAFCIEYLKSGNATDAYRRCYNAGNSNPATINRKAKELIDNGKITARLAILRQPAIEKAQVSVEATLREAWSIMTADPREFVEYRVGACRFCYGEGHRYQFTNAEFEREESMCAEAAEKAVEDGKPVKPFDPKGGPGFDKSAQANPECPECVGEGVGRTVFKDTRHVSKAAASLFAGIKETKDGLEVKMHSKDGAMDKMFRHLGLYNDKLELTMPTVRIKDFTGKA